MSRVVALWLALASGPALAAPDCEPLTEGAFRDLSLLLRSGVDRGDADLVETMVAEFDAQVSCLVFAPDPHALADILVLRAIAAYAAEGDWETPMAAALRIWPAVDRVVSSRHPLATWEPPEQAAPAPLHETRDRLYIDGLPDQGLPPPGSMALVQRTDGTWWNSWLVTPATPLPEGWVDEPVQPPPHVAVRGLVSLMGGAVSRTQTPDFDTDWLQTLEASDATMAGSGLSGGAVVTFHSPFGFLAHGTAWLLAKSPGIDGHVAGVWAPKNALLGVGVGTSSVETLEGPPDDSRLAARTGQSEQRRLYMLRYLAAVGQVRWGKQTTWQLETVVGGSNNLRRLSGEALVGLPGERTRNRWLLGLGASTVQGRFEQVDAGPNRTFSGGSSRAWLSVGWALGEW